MIILFEGPDNVGKGTQIKMLREKLFQLPFLILHFTGPPKGAPILYQKELFTNMFNTFNFCSEKKISLIADRSHLGEAVYGLIYRKTDISWVFNLEHSYLKAHPNLTKGIILITLVAEGKTLISRNDLKSYYHNEESATKEADVFIEAFKKCKITQKLLINIGDQTEQEIHETIVAFINENFQFEY